MIARNTGLPRLIQEREGKAKQMSPKRRILALIFDWETVDSQNWLLIAWLNSRGNSKHLVPAHPDRNLLDVKAGDVLTFKRKEILTVKSLRPWRTSECRDETQYTEIRCGADWQAS